MKCKPGIFSRTPAKLMILVTLFCLSCNMEEEQDPVVSPDNIFLDYQVWGEEELPVVTVMLQFRIGGKNGPTLLLGKNGEVKLDGKLISPDSTKMTGAFYEVQVPLESFKGKHEITWTDINKNEYREEFEFAPLALKTPLPDTIYRNDLVLDLDGLGEEGFVRVVLTDTARHNDGINRLDTVLNGQLIVHASDLGQLSDGPVHLELVKEQESELKEGPRRGGRMSVWFTVRREFVLQSSR